MFSFGAHPRAREQEPRPHRPPRGRTGRRGSGRIVANEFAGTRDTEFAGSHARVAWRHSNEGGERGPSGATRGIADTASTSRPDLGINGGGSRAPASVSSRGCLSGVHGKLVIASRVDAEETNDVRVVEGGEEGDFAEHGREANDGGERGDRRRSATGARGSASSARGRATREAAKTLRERLAQVEHLGRPQRAGAAVAHAEHVAEGSSPDLVHDLKVGQKRRPGLHLHRPPTWRRRVREERRSSEGGG